MREKPPDEWNVLDNFVVLEGLDGAGTTTQLKLLDKELTRLSIPHFCTFEPTDGPIGRMLRAILRKELEVHPRTTALLFAADRSEHLTQPQDGILGRLRRGELVVCDRYLFSSLAYQGVLDDFEYVFELNRRFPLPCRLIFLETPVEISLERLHGRGEEELYEQAETQRRVLQQGYHRVFELFRGSPMSIHRIGGAAAPPEIFLKIWRIVRSLPIVKG
jgi:dTMP kinase